MSARLARTLQMHRDPHAVLVQGVADRRFGMLCSDHPSDNLSRSKLDAMGEPGLVAVVSDDSPQRTARARDMRTWCAYAIVLDTQHPRETYERIAAIVPVYRRVLLIETLPTYTADWLAFLASKPGGDFDPEGDA